MSARPGLRGPHSLPPPRRALHSALGLAASVGPWQRDRTQTCPLCGAEDTKEWVEVPGESLSPSGKTGARAPRGVGQDTYLRAARGHCHRTPVEGAGGTGALLGPPCWDRPGNPVVRAGPARGPLQRVTVIVPLNFHSKNDLLVCLSFISAQRLGWSQELVTACPPKRAPGQRQGMLDGTEGLLTLQPFLATLGLPCSPGGLRTNGRPPLTFPAS